MNNNDQKKPKNKQKRFANVYNKTTRQNPLDQAKVEKRAIKLLEKHQNARAANDEYLAALLYPKDSPGCRVPSLLPIPSATARLQQTGSVTANATGFLKIMLLPGENGWACHVWNASTDTDVSVGANAIAVYGVNPVVSTVAQQWRPVSGELRVWSIANSNVGAGLYSMSTVPAATHSAINFDFVRDQQDTVFGTHGTVFKGIYKPLDATCMEFKLTANSFSSGEYCYPVFCASGCAANQAFAYSFVVNYEYIPTLAYTDLINVSLPQASDGFSALSLLRRGASIVADAGRGILDQFPHVVGSMVSKGIRQAGKGRVGRAIGMANAFTMMAAPSFAKGIII